MNTEPPSLPLAQWREDTRAAIEDIQSLGLEMVEKHETASDRAAEVSENWKLADRQRDEHDALLVLLDAIHAVMSAVDPALSSENPSVLAVATTAIDGNIERIESSFWVVRHAALDVLRWTRRSGRLEDSDLPARYRASYARLLAHTPVFRPALMELQRRLLDLSRDPNADAEVTRLLSALTRYNGVLDTARDFVRVIVDPPLELVFQETQVFLDDWEGLPIETRVEVSSELNDVCQFMLYDEADFEKAVEQVRPALSDGVEASMYALDTGGRRVLFTVDEDPVFQQLTVTLYRVTPPEEFADARDAVVRSLYAELIEVDHG